MDNTNVLVDFRIIGDNYNIQEITDILLIKPSRYWKSGDDILQTGRKYDCTEWIFSTGYEETLDISTQIKKIKSIFLEKSNQLVSLREKYNLKYCIEIVIKIENNAVPAIYLDSEIINFAAIIGATFDFDTYINF
ncbi:DUF4279 domain-containing protein [Anaerocolumna chitinilytica]|uniref:DUF4279 domain-containing protein n=1 Tax=Anaerocolumna chitinilytica TaxID=1727145 RepID=A0A7I8DLW4_9FIRM|nr:DUF4279 domain-containing protein [Anaerocolumna chitinilytica]BCJ98304.1 hypothetical protein bsdcttw_13450 [Anaerocolumna chitinilytica]